MNLKVVNFYICGFTVFVLRTLGFGLSLKNAVAPVPATGPVFLRLESRQWDSNKILTDPGDTHYSLVTPLITTYQDIAERSAGTWWYNGNGRRVVMAGALVRILTAVVFLFF